ncbi:TPA: hypothetical protein N5O38_004519 [Enterobacter hormaechei subsp. steigerwaltii]|nr:hypothetical protein [Enterobacter hormaechei subsp. steigerwaltii]
MLSVGDFGLGGAPSNIPDGYSVRDFFNQSTATQFYSSGSAVKDTVTSSGWRDYLKIEHGTTGNYKTVLEISNIGVFGMHVKTGPGAWVGSVIYGTANTTRASDGTLKAASPVIKVFSDGSYQTNYESEGCTVTRLATGQYLIEGCQGLNSDAAWGGIDGGFDIPNDRNKQPLIWLDYEVSADGSVLVKTYHRTHPDAPAFARNELEGVGDGDPVDIPRDQFVSVRVEMPADSLYNQKIRAAELAMTADAGE